MITCVHPQKVINLHMLSKSWPFTRTIVEELKKPTPSLYLTSHKNSTHHAVTASSTPTTGSETSHQDSFLCQRGVVTEDGRSSATRREVCRETIGQVSTTI